MDMLTPECCECLVKAVSVLDDRVTALISGALTIEEFKLVKKTEEKFPELAELVQKHPAAYIKKAFAIRQKELNDFEMQASQMATLASLCQHMPKGMTEFFFLAFLRCSLSWPYVHMILLFI